jgi:hypothetical protein
MAQVRHRHVYPIHLPAPHFLHGRVPLPKGYGHLGRPAQALQRAPPQAPGADKGEAVLVRHQHLGPAAPQPLRTRNGLPPHQNQPSITGPMRAIRAQTLAS